VIRAGHSQTLVDVVSLSAIHEHFNQFVNNHELPESQLFADELLIAHQDKVLDDALRESQLKVQIIDDLPELAEGAPSKVIQTVNLELSDDEIRERLLNGVEIEIQLGSFPSRGRLHWVSNNLSNVVLCLENQANPSMISGKTLKRLIEQGRISFLENEVLFERAIRSLLESADEMDQDALVTSNL